MEPSIVGQNPECRSGIFKGGLPILCVERMAYLQKENETVEMAYPLTKVWKAVQRVVKRLGWKTELIDEAAHHVEARTKGGLMSYSSLLLVDVVTVNDDTTRVSVAAQTPVTTITGMVGFGQAKQRINLFLMALSKQLGN